MTLRRSLSISVLALVGLFASNRASALLAPQDNWCAYANSSGNDADGLPDRWETDHGLSMLDPDTLGDPDGDGVPNLAEYAQGLDPLRGDQASLLPFASTAESGPSRFLSLSFRRLLSPPPGLTYSVEESSDLATWTPLDSAEHQVGSAAPQGDGTELVTIQGSLPLSGPDAEPAAFLHLRINRSAP